jgi:hypothetical protein
MKKNREQGINHQLRRYIIKRTLSFAVLALLSAFAFNKFCHLAIIFPKAGECLCIRPGKPPVWAFFSFAH